MPLITVGRERLLLKSPCLPSYQESSQLRELSICLFRDMMETVVRRDKRRMKKKIQRVLVPLFFHMNDQTESVAKVQISKLNSDRGRGHSAGLGIGGEGCWQSYSGNMCNLRVALPKSLRTGQSSPHPLHRSRCCLPPPPEPPTAEVARVLGSPPIPAAPIHPPPAQPRGRKGPCRASTSR